MCERFSSVSPEPFEGEHNDMDRFIRDCHAYFEVFHHQFMGNLVVHGRLCHLSLHEMRKGLVDSPKGRSVDPGSSRPRSSTILIPTLGQFRTGVQEAVQ